MSDSDYDDEGPLLPYSKYFRPNEGSLAAILTDACDVVPRRLVTTGGAAKCLPAAPGLLVDGRQFSVPLSDAEAAALAAVGAPSPFGRGQETVLDKDVRSSLEVNPQRFSFSNPAWSRGIKELTEEVAEQLGCAASARGRLEAWPHKLLLYRAGDHFEAHRDTEKQAGMLATLVVQLPSACAGGRLVVEEVGGRLTPHDFGASSGQAPFQAHFAAFYADVQHHVEEVTAGARLAVVYNLVWTPRHLSTSPCQPDVEWPHNESLAENSMVKSLCEADWGSQLGEPLLFMLRHEYTRASMETSFAKDSLKGDDRFLLEVVEEANRQLPANRQLEAMMVELNRGITCWHDVPIDEASISAVEMVSFFSVGDSKKVTFNIEPERSLVYYAPREDCWKIHAGEAHVTGNEGLSAEFTYCHSGLVVFPATHRCLLTRSENPYGFVKGVEHLLDEDAISNVRAVSACQWVLQRRESPSESAVSTIVAVFVKAGVPNIEGIRYLVKHIGSIPPVACLPFLKRRMWPFSEQQAEYFSAYVRTRPSSEAFQFEQDPPLPFLDRIVLQNIALECLTLLRFSTVGTWHHLYAALLELNAPLEILKAFIEKGSSYPIAADASLAPTWLRLVKRVSFHELETFMRPIAKEFPAFFFSDLASNSEALEQEDLASCTAMLWEVILRKHSWPTLRLEWQVEAFEFLSQTNFKGDLNLEIDYVWTFLENEESSGEGMRLLVPLVLEYLDELLLRPAEDFLPALSDEDIAKADPLVRDFLTSGKMEAVVTPAREMDRVEVEALLKDYKDFSSLRSGKEIRLYWHCKEFKRRVNGYEASLRKVRTGKAFLMRMGVDITNRHWPEVTELESASP